MANQLYDEARTSLQSAEIDLLTDNIITVLINRAGYTVDLVNHQFLQDVAGAGRTATSGNLTGKTVNAGVFDATDATWFSVSGVSSEDTLFAQDTGNEATSRLILYCDTFQSGMPVIPNGGDILYQFDDGPARIYGI